MKTTVIISVYKDVQALSLIIDSLLHQTVDVDEIIVSEDCMSDEMKQYISTLEDSRIKHLSQEDNGWQKNKALNRAIKESSHEYLIFLDGDCIPFPDFLEYHKLLSEENNVLCGRRTEPGEFFSTQIREKQLSIKSFIKDYFKNFKKLKQDNIRHYDDGIHLSPKSLLWKTITKLRKKENHIVGCHFSCWKKDLEMINGFDEDFKLPTTGEDMDIERRLRHFGVKMKSCRYSANVIHLFHKKVFNSDITSQTEAMMENKKDVFICENGLERLNITETK